MFDPQTLQWLGFGAVIGVALTVALIGGCGVLLVGPFDNLGFLRIGDRIVRRENAGMSQRLQHDTAFACATVLCERIEHLLRPEEIKDAHEEFYTAVKAALEKYEELRSREEARLK